MQLKLKTYNLKLSTSMAINKNHEFGDLNGIKCAIVEKGISAERVEFLKKLLEYNHYTVVVVADPPPKVAPSPVATPAIVSTEIKTEETNSTASSIVTSTETPKAPETFTLGITDSTFNATNAIFGRLLKTPDGHIVTQAYWFQKESESHDEVPYYEKKL